MRTYFTKEGTILRQPTKEEVDREFETFTRTTIGKLILQTLQKLHPDQKENIKDILKQNYEA